MSRLTRNVTTDQILRRERGQGNIDFPCLADLEQDWQAYPVDPSGRPNHSRTSETYRRQDPVFWYELQLLLSGVVCSTPYTRSQGSKNVFRNNF